jgi:hypothetical protein
MTHSSDAIWLRERQIAERSLRLNREMHAFDVQSCRAQKSCLGTAHRIELDALRLVLTGYDQDAREYFGHLKELALAGYDSNEHYIYSELDDNNFARYVAMRMCYHAEWILSDENTVFLDRALAHLTSTHSQAGQDDSRLWAIALHTAESGRWDETKTLPEPDGLDAPRVGLLQTIVHLASSPHESEPLISKFENEVAKLSLSKTPDRFDPHGSTWELVSLAHIRARLRGIRDPFDALKWLRFQG